MEMKSFLPLFERIDGMLKKGSVILAVDGGSASGKTTLGNILSEKYDCTLFHMDDFFLQPHQRTKERYAEAGGNVDRERFLEEVLLPLSKNQEISYRRFDCSSFKLLSPEIIVPKRLNVVEGAYSMHPELEKYYDLKVFLDIDKEIQTERIKKRNGPMMAERFFNEWIPLEERYFSQTDVKKRCDMIISVFE